MTGSGRAPLPGPRGAISRKVLDAMLGRGPVRSLARDIAAVTDVLGDEDLHLALWCLYELHYRGLDGVADELEWDPHLLACRRELEEVFLQGLRVSSKAACARARAGAGDVIDQIRLLIAEDTGPDLATFVQRHADVNQFRDVMVQRSLYTLKESDPSSFVLPRVDGPAKVALAELQYDEYGGGRPDRLHARLFASAMEHCGLDSGYAHYIGEASGSTLALNNAMSLFALHRGLRGAALGHLATFEATSTIPCRRIAAGVRRLRLPDAVWHYFDEHVEADAVHEEVALRSICARIVSDQPDLRDDVLLGSATCLLMDGAVARSLLEGWGVDGGVGDCAQVPA